MRAALATALTGVLLLPAGAQAAEPRFNAPPGNSGVEEYLETLPTGKGRRPTNKLLAPSGGYAPVGARSGRRVAAAGSEGQAALQVARATSAGEHLRRPRASGSAERALPAALVEQTFVATDRGGMGLFFPLLLAASLAAAVAYALVRRRASPS